MAKAHGVRMVVIEGDTEESKSSCLRGNPARTQWAKRQADETVADYRLATAESDPRRRSVQGLCPDNAKYPSFLTKIAGRMADGCPCSFPVESEKQRLGGKMVLDGESV